MDAKNAARIFHDWAVGEGLLPDGPVAPVTSIPAELALLDGIDDVGKQVLRNKQIQSVAFNEQARQVVVFTKRVAPTTKKQLASVPGQIDDISIKYRQGLQTPVGGLPSTPFGGPVYVTRQVGAESYYTCGSSISVGNFRDAGTMGCLVRDANGVLFGLSNNHVSGSCSFAGVNMPILAPGVFDVAPNNLPPFTIGFHSSSLPMVAGSADNVDATGNLDAAIFRLADAGRVSSFQGAAYDTPLWAGPLVPGMVVEKVGRTTGHTHGQVAGQMHGAHPIAYSAALYGFNGQVSFDPVFAVVGQGQLFSDNGDSGSLVTTVDGAGQRIAVGIVVGGMTDGSAPGGKTTIILPIEAILNALNVTLVSGHNI